MTAHTYDGSLMKKTVLLTAIAAALFFAPDAVRAQNYIAPTPPPEDSSNRIATTAFVQQSFSVCYSIDAFYQTADGTDWLPAWNRIVASFGSTSDICIEFGPKTYSFSAQASVTVALNYSIRLFGEGKTVTHLLWPNNTPGMVITSANQSAVDVSDLDFRTGTTNSNNALTINSSDCTGAAKSSGFRNLAFAGSGSYPFTNYWTYGLVINTLSFVNLTNIDFFGDSGNHMTGLQYQSTNSGGGCYGIVFNADQINFINNATGFSIGTYVQGITVDHSNFTNGNYGIVLANTAYNVDQIVVSNSQFNTSAEQIYINPASSSTLGTQIHHNTFTIPASHTGIHITGGSWHVIDGNILINGASYGVTGLTAIQIDNNNSSAGGGVITGNFINNVSYGVALAAPTTNWNVQSNAYGPSVTTQVSNSGTGNTIGGGSK